MSDVALDLGPIKEREAKATAGPWGVCTGPLVYSEVGSHGVAMMSWTADISKHWLANAYFVAAARTDIPLLVAEVEQLRAEVQRLKRRLNHQTEDDIEACRRGAHTDCGILG